MYARQRVANTVIHTFTAVALRYSCKSTAAAAAYATMSATQNKTVAPYGTWKSPITADLLTQKSVSFADIIVISSGSSQAKIAYIENRPHEQGRAALVARTINLERGSSFGRDVSHNETPPTDISKGEHNVRTGVQEYGGGPATSAGQGKVVFTDYKTFAVLEADESGNIRTLTKDNKMLRYGDFSKHPTLPLVAAICEDHTIDEPAKVVNTLTVISTESAEVHTIASGNDFYTNPRFSPDGKYIAWVTWNHPSMPFWATELWVARFDASSRPSISRATKVLGNHTDQIAHHPLWADASTLYFASDAQGDYLNLWKVGLSDEEDKSALTLQGPRPLLPNKINGDFMRTPWMLGYSSFALLSPEWLVASVIAQAFSSINLVHIPTGTLKHLDTPFVDVSYLQVTSAVSIVFVGSEERQPSSLIAMDLTEVLNTSTQKVKPTWQVIKRSSSIVDDGTVSPDYLPKCEAIEFPTELPNGCKSTSHALLFLPSNPDYAAPAGTSPPCIMKIHGGPTSVSVPGLSLSTSYWTSRGYSICVVNHGGSTSFGRKFMERLNGQWGVIYVRDTVAAASYLGSAEHGKGNAKAIRRINSAGLAQIANLEEKRFDNGAVQFTVRNDSTWTSVLMDIAVGVSLGAATLLMPSVDLRAGLAVGGLSWLLRHVTRVQEETVLVSPNVGVQLSTVRGFRLPGLRNSWPAKQEDKRSPSSNLVMTSAKTKLIPRDAIMDLVTNEAIRRWNVVDYIGIVGQAPASLHDVKATERAVQGHGGALQVIFPNLLPRLPVVEHVYRSIYPVLFGGSEGVTNMSASAASLPRVDPKKIAISGGSAGGFTVLGSLYKYPRAFGAGADYYGVSNLADLAAESHKFESQYAYQLVGGKPDEIPDVYRERSAIYHSERIESPLLILQGSIDKVVPPEQNKGIYRVLKDLGRKTKYIEFEGEGHGFRLAANIKRSLEEEEAWYREVFKL